MSHRRLAAGLWIAATVILTASQALAFGDAGHKIICEIAWQRLTPAARTLVLQIQADANRVVDPVFRACGTSTTCTNEHQNDARPMTFQAGCVWADEAREDTYKDTYDQHFINVSKAHTSLDLARDCAALDCAVVGIQRAARYIATKPSGDRERERRVLALRFLGHFVGDMHQPLHVGWVEDLGGNFIRVKWDHDGKPTTAAQDKTLHSVWDSAILTRGSLTDQVTDGAALNKTITAAQLKEWQTFDVEDWAAKSYELAQSTAYRKRDANGTVSDVRSGDVLSTPYYEAGLPVITEQVQKAGVRLAYLINAAAAGTLPVNLVKLD